MNQQLGPNQTLWLEALRSNNYAQGRYSLRREDRFCCLGVACEIFGVPSSIPDEGSVAYGLSEEVCGAPIETIELLQLYGQAGDDVGSSDSLAHMNDNGASFTQIADLITANPERYFRSPK